jgi:hemolysin activation/secretion protein
MNMSRCSLRRPRGGSKFWCLPLLGLLLPATQAWSQVSDPATQQLLRQQERERVLRTQAESRPDVRLERALGTALDRLPSHESPCFPIRRIALDGEAAARFAWALQAADPATDPATGRCLGTAGVGTVLRRVQNAIVARGFVTTRVLASPQDLKTGVLTLTLVPGRIHAIRFAVDSDPRATAWNAVPAHPGELLNLRDVEQALENFKRVPTVEADIRIVPAEGPDARPGESDLVIGWFHPRTLRLGLTLDDSGSQSTGRLQAGATVSVDDLLHANDLFYVNLGRSVLNGHRRAPPAGPRTTTCRSGIGWSAPRPAATTTGRRWTGRTRASATAARAATRSCASRAVFIAMRR